MDLHRKQRAKPLIDMPIIMVRPDAIGVPSTATERPVPRPSLASRFSPGPDPRLSAGGNTFGSPLVSLPGTPPVLVRASGHAALGEFSARSSDCKSYSLPSLPQETPDMFESMSSASSSNAASPTPRCGIRRPSLISDERVESVREFRRRLSGKLSDLVSSMSDLVEKVSTRSGRNSPEHGSPRSGRSSPLRGDSGSGRVTPLPRSPRSSRVVPDGARETNAVIDREIDLADPKFLDFVKQAAEAAFIKTWVHDSADTKGADGNQSPNASRLRPTFIRDFGNSNYCVRKADGSQEKIRTEEEFLAYMDQRKGSELPRIVSNIASQNLGNFLKNSLFLRKDANGQSQSLLRFWDDSSLLPVANVKAEYVFEKKQDGTIILDYCWESSSTVNGSKPMQARCLASDGSTEVIRVQDHASLRITTRITIEDDGEWHIGNPRVQASGWNLPAEE